MPRVRLERTIDITNAPVVSAASLRRKLERIHAAGEFDGGLPILRNGVLVGLIPSPDLEFALDQLPEEESAMCLMATNVPSIDDSDEEYGPDPKDFTRYIDPVRIPADNICFEMHSNSSTGTSGSRHTFAHGPRLRVLREAWAEVYLRPPRRQVRRYDAQEDLCQVHKGAPALE